MRHPILAVVAVLVVAGGCSGSTVTVTNVTTDGNVVVDSTGSDQLPPVGAVVSKDGIQPLPTPPPVEPQPVYPITPPAPTPTARAS